MDNLDTEGPHKLQELERHAWSNIQQTDAQIRRINEDVASKVFRPVEETMNLMNTILQKLIDKTITMRGESDTVAREKQHVTDELIECFQASITNAASTAVAQAIGESKATRQATCEAECRYTEIAGRV